MHMSVQRISTSITNIVRELDKRITEEANAILSNRQEKDADKKSIVIFNKDWHKGLFV